MSPSPSAIANAQTQQDSTMVSIESSQHGLPQELLSEHPLWEIQRTGTSNKPASITRLYDDGRLYTWSDSRRIVVDGLPSRESAPYAWRLDAQLRTEGVNRVRALIESDFVQLSPEEVFAAPDQGILTWRSVVNGAEHTITLPITASDRLPQVIQDIDYAIQSNIIPGAVPLEQ